MCPWLYPHLVFSVDVPCLGLLGSMQRCLYLVPCSRYFTKSQCSALDYSEMVWRPVAALLGVPLHGQLGNDVL
jgi:hypothetical protein